MNLFGIIEEQQYKCIIDAVQTGFLFILRSRIRGDEGRTSSAYSAPVHGSAVERPPYNITFDQLSFLVAAVSEAAVAAVGVAVAVAVAVLAVAAVGVAVVLAVGVAVVAAVGVAVVVAVAASVVAVVGTTMVADVGGAVVVAVAVSLVAVDVA